MIPAGGSEIGAVTAIKEPRSALTRKRAALPQKNPSPAPRERVPEAEPRAGEDGAAMKDPSHLPAPAGAGPSLSRGAGEGLSASSLIQSGRIGTSFVASADRPRS